MKTARPLVVALLLGAAVQSWAAPLNPGAGSYAFTDKQGNADRPITVHFFRPEGLTENSPVVFVMHGVKRNGDEYRDAWVRLAKQYGFLLIVPEFSVEHYRGGRRYNLGFRHDEKGKLRPKSKWAFTAIEHVFDQVVEQNNLAAKDYVIYGHSAGGQFVHRLALLVPEARFRIAVAANPGWYTMPTRTTRYPHGLQGSGLTNRQLKRALGNRLLVLLGDQDTDPKHKYLTRTKAAMKQGPHRFARGKRFFQTGKQTASDLQTPFRWRLETVPGVGHSNHGMAGPAAGLMGFED